MLFVSFLGKHKFQFSLLNYKQKELPDKLFGSSFLLFVFHYLRELRFPVRSLFKLHVGFQRFFLLFKSLVSLVNHFLYCGLRLVIPARAHLRKNKILVFGNA